MFMIIYLSANLLNFILESHQSEVGVICGHQNKTISPQTKLFPNHNAFEEILFRDGEIFSQAQ